ncbi:hypothetical protein U9M48_036332 [Paspalum notatum var. saurae]|uniref:Uncharacterized protein n=1 Tax=Paspalum notatum var. saurae TaxID=547442 RepID=A0AAQ3UIZ1_PASNO
MCWMLCHKGGNADFDFGPNRELVGDVVGHIVASSRLQLDPASKFDPPQALDVKYVKDYKISSSLGPLRRFQKV